MVDLLIRSFSLEMAGVREKDGDHINVPGSREWGHLEGEGWGKQESNCPPGSETESQDATQHPLKSYIDWMPT